MAAGPRRSAFLRHAIKQGARIMYEGREVEFAPSKHYPRHPWHMKGQPDTFHYRLAAQECEVVWSSDEDTAVRGS